MSSLQKALGDALGIMVEERLPNTQVYKKTLDPWNPSQKWISFVKNPLPIPTECRYCNQPVTIVNNKAIYGRPYGEWPWAYRCSDRDCGAYVGMHPKTNIPLGTLANSQLREARKEAKEFFNPIWQEKYMTRSEAYAWLAAEMNITPVEDCHIGWMEVDQCRRVVSVCSPIMEKIIEGVFEKTMK